MKDSSILSTRTISSAVFMFYPSFMMFQIFIMFEIHKLGFWLYFRHEAYI